MTTDASAGAVPEAAVPEQAAASCGPGSTGNAAPPDAARISRLGQLGVAVTDLEAMTAFYREALGLHFLFAAPGMSFFDLGGVRLMLSRPERGSEQAHGSILYLEVADVAAAHATLLGRGVVFAGPPHVIHRYPGGELWMAFFRDPEENLLALMSDVRTAS